MTIYLPIDPAQYESISADRDAWRERSRDLEVRLRLAEAQRDEARAVAGARLDADEPHTSIRQPYLAGEP
jgi:hypothetical protein